MVSSGCHHGSSPSSSRVVTGSVTTHWFHAGLRQSRGAVCRPVPVGSLRREDEPHLRVLPHHAMPVSLCSCCSSGHQQFCFLLGPRVWFLAGRPPGEISTLALPGVVCLSFLDLPRPSCGQRVDTEKLPGAWTDAACCVLLCASHCSKGTALNCWCLLPLHTGAVGRSGAFLWRNSPSCLSGCTFVALCITFFFFP